MQNPFVRAVFEFLQKISLNVLREMQGIVYFVPSTNLLPELYDYFGVNDFDDLFRTQDDRFDYVRSIQRESYSLEKSPIDIFLEESKLSVESEKKEVFRNMKFTFMFVDGFPLDKKMEKVVTENVELSKNVKRNLGVLPKAVFGHMVLEGQIRGEDLIRLCSTDTVVRSKCDENLMRNVLRKEFGIQDYDHRYSDSAYEIYRLIYTVKTQTKILGRNTYFKPERVFDFLYITAFGNMRFLVKNATDIDIGYSLVFAIRHYMSGVPRLRDKRLLEEKDLKDLWNEKRLEILASVNDPNILSPDSRQILTELDINQWSNDLLQHLRDSSSKFTKDQIVATVKTQNQQALSKQYYKDTVTTAQLEAIWALHELVMKGIVSVTASLRWILGFSFYVSLLDAGV